MGHHFRVGEVYGNRLGSYQVVSIDEPNMVVCYSDGRLLQSDIATLARIWENMQIEAERALPVQKATESSSQVHSPKSKAKPKGGSTFAGLVENDFKDGVTGTTWRSRENLGGLLARTLSDAVGKEFQSWAIYRRAELALAYTARYVNEKQWGTRQAKFAFELGPEGARYGFYIERNWGAMDETWDWLCFKASLGAEPEALQGVTAAMRKHGVTGRPVLVGRDQVESLAGRLIAGPNGLAWSAGDTREPVPTSWSQFAELLTSLEPNKWCDLYFYAETDKPEAIKLGLGIAERAVEVYLDLLPLYRMSLRQTLASSLR